jgi:hypothetical protein
LFSDKNEYPISSASPDFEAANPGKFIESLAEGVPAGLRRFFI